jgi:hypothetical protein
MNKMDIQCPFEYLAIVHVQMRIGLPKNYKHAATCATSATTYKHAVVLKIFVEINK